MILTVSKCLGNMIQSRLNVAYAIFDESMIALVMYSQRERGSVSHTSQEVSESTPNKREVPTPEKTVYCQLEHRRNNINFLFIVFPNHLAIP